MLGRTRLPTSAVSRKWSDSILTESENVVPWSLGNELQYWAFVPQSTSPAYLNRRTDLQCVDYENAMRRHVNLLKATSRCIWHPVVCDPHAISLQIRLGY